MPCSSVALAIALLAVCPAHSFVPARPARGVRLARFASADPLEIASPFEDGNLGSKSGDDDDGPLPLTADNVETVLDEMRPYLMSDGGNVALREIDGPVVKLELQGACGTCPSSTMTMKMGLERRLKEKIPEIEEVIQAIPEAPDLTEEAVEEILDGVRPFLQVAGGTISLASITGVGGLQPSIELKMEGASATLQSVKVEIMERIRRNFMISGLRISWVDEA